MVELEGREAGFGKTSRLSMITERQQEILDFIREQQDLRGMTPTTAEIMERFGFASPNAVTSHLQALERKGAILREPNKARGLVLADSYRGRAMIEIPIYGSIAAGLPSDERQQPDGCISVDVETLRLPKGARVFALKVRGDSMIGAGILSGDVVVLEFREARNGEVVAALIDGETTLKRYVVQRGRPFLKAENPRFKDLIPAQELVIQGVQVALLRILKP
jgi:repressor LexA